MKVLDDFEDPLPECAFEMLLKDNATNSSDKIRGKAYDLLKDNYESNEELSDEIREKISFEMLFHELNGYNDMEVAKIKSTLKEILKYEFKDVIFSKAMEVIIELLSIDENNEYIEYLLKIVLRFLEEDTPLSNNYIIGFMNLCNTYRDNVEYIKNLQRTVTQYDQFSTEDAQKVINQSISSLKEQEDVDIKSSFFNILEVLSKRNITFNSKQIKELLELFKSDSQIYVIVKNILENIEKIDDEIGEAIKGILIERNQYEEGLQLLAYATRSGYIVTEDIVKLLVKLSREHPEFCSHIYKIYSNLTDHGVELSKELECISSIGKGARIISDEEEEYRIRLETTNQLVEEIKKVSSVPESLIFVCQDVIRKDITLELAEKCYTLILKTCQKFPKYLDMIDWQMLTQAIVHDQGSKKKNSVILENIMLLFECLLRNKRTPPPGILSILAKGEDKKSIIDLINRFSQIMPNGFSEQDPDCKRLLKVYNTKKIGTMEDLENFLKVDQNELSNNTIKVFKRSLENEEVKKDIMHKLKEKMYDGQLMPSIVDKYIDHIPDDQVAEFVTPLVINRELDIKNANENEIEGKQDSIDKVIEKMAKGAQNDKGIIENCKLVRLACFHDTYFPECEKELEDIIQGDYNQEVKVEAALTLVTLKEQSGNYKYNLDKKLLKNILKYIDQDSGFRKLDDEDHSDAVRRISMNQSIESEDVIKEIALQKIIEMKK